MFVYIFFFFFSSRRRHTRFKCDWSSDVCSSDLPVAGAARARRRQAVKRLAIATRSSRLALWQAGHVKQRLEALHAGLEVGLLPMTTRGDELIDQRLDQAGGKGLFIKELENALADGRADIAVHSMKDVPADL